MLWINGYELDETFANQKTILRGMLVVKNKENNVYGLIDADSGEELFGVKYASIKYLPAVGDCIVSDNKGDKQKYGVLSPLGEKKTKIDVVYDDIELLDIKTNLYVVCKDNKYGIVDTSGNTKVPIEFDQIGIDISLFKENNVKNKYLLLGNLIPVKRKDKWALSDINGNRLCGFEYDSFGYISKNSADALNLLVISDYNYIVACKGEKYGLIDMYGKLADYGVNFDDIYMKKEAGVYNYYANYNDKTQTVKYYLDQLGANASQASKTSNVPSSTEQKTEQTVAPEQQLANLQEEVRKLEEQAQQRQLTPEEDAYLNQLRTQIETMQQPANQQPNQQLNQQPNQQVEQTQQ